MKIFLTFTFALLVYSGFAQQDSDTKVLKNSISITLGSNQFKEENLHLKAFRGMTIGTSYRHTKINKNISEYTAGLKISLLKTTFENFPSSVSILILGDYKYLFNIIKNERLSYYLGPVVDLQYGASAYFNWDESHLYFANYLGGGIGSRITYSLGDKSLDFNLDIPFISCIFRPENNRQYKIDDMTFGGIFKNLSSNPEGALPYKNFFVKAGLDMKYKSKRSKTRSVGYNFKYHYMHASDGNPFQNIEHSVSYKFIF